MMGDAGRERVWSSLGARHGGVGTAKQTDSYSSSIAMVKKFSKAGGIVDALNAVAPHTHTHTHTHTHMQ